MRLQSSGFIRKLDKGLQELPTSKLTQVAVEKLQSLTMWTSPWDCLRIRVDFPQVRNMKERETKQKNIP